MTIAQLIECLVGKVSAIRGHETDGTPFSNIDIDSLKDILESYGYERNCTEYLYNGMTGRKIRSMIFLGPTYYQRLKHMVGDKQHCLTMDHEVLTANGWKFFDQLSKDDLIATLKDGELVYDKPIDLLYYPDFKGKMYEINTQNVNLKVTTNHRMWVSLNDGKYKLITADKLVGKEVRYQRNAAWLDSCGDIALVHKMTNYGNVVVFNDNKQADDFTISCLHAGQSANKTKKVDGTYEVVVINDNRPVVDKMTESDYEGPVFCLQVPSEVFYVRRNGIPVWTGNSRARGPRTVLTRSPPEGDTAQVKTLSVFWLVHKCIYGRHVQIAGNSKKL
jgi:hypothetical protein